MEKEEGNDKGWVFFCILICILGATLAGTTLWGRHINLKTGGIILGAGIIGFLVGFLSRKRGKAARTLSFIICALIFAGLFGGAKFVTSDFFVAKKPWPRHIINNVSFTYPGNFTDYDLSEELVEKGAVKLCVNNDSARFAHYMEYDFTGDYPELEESIKNVVTNMVTSFRGKVIFWDDDNKTPDTILQRFTYTFNRKQYTGLVFGYEKGNHCEIVAFYPIKKKFSDAFLTKIENSIEVEK